MMLTSPTSEQLASLPHAMWVNLGKRMLLCRGEPTDIVRGLAKEMGLPASRKIRPLLVALSEALAQNVRLLIELEDNVPPAKLAPLFVHALLTTGIGRPMAQA